MANNELLRMWFDSVDVDRSGSINCEELQRALAVGNLHFPSSVVNQMIKLYDTDLNGTMSFNEFISLHQFLTVVQDSFQANLRNREQLSLNEVYNALTQAGFSLDQPAFYCACQSFDKERRGHFRLDNYMSLCIFLKSARNLFTSFDTSRAGAVTLDFNQFVYCAANMRI
ncbi:hypothetical protein MPTK1_5g13250 [Marchantia polymorpha subsp. ruderalis]|uniref:EF-hand domain-containing protein n=2 Tax=Marchantia polymorpha TaxID=3197 RepID=A0AAF6BHW5_MARPO|nr:hypothetical protein MARPO_0032s0019 [Marchantia polymorpha]BBN11599.1 hypothetical protein Mp_5g13250 [Marchantia polymorpha subsp. ruderalis]|eukprot:PTQ41813.1 hypothetical protein MARPO_0032s0019 [Marchantia polymorpha]